MTNFKIILGDITKIKFDAIVNAANTSLLGGGGVDGAIHRACGEKLLEECRTLNGCLTGKAKITKSYNLSEIGVYWVIHTVGPIYRNSGSEEKYLRSAYRSVLDVAANYAHCYTNQITEYINKNLYLFNANIFAENKQKDFLIKDSMEYVKEHPIKTIAFPSISTGAYSYPLEKACNIALDEILSFIESSPDVLEEIAIICIDEKTYTTFQKLYEQRL